MKSLKTVALLTVLALSLGMGTGAAIAAASPLSSPDQSGSSVEFVFGEYAGKVYVVATPGSSYTLTYPGAAGETMWLGGGTINQNGLGQTSFQIPTGLDVTTIIVTVLTPGRPPLYFAYDSDLDRWILD